MKTITLNFKTGIFSVVLLFSSFSVKGQNPTNGGFENGSDGWTLTPIGNYTPSVVSTNAPRTGSNHLQINYIANDGTTNYKTGTVSSAVNILTGQYFHMIGWAKKVGTYGTFVFGVSGTINDTPSSGALTPDYTRYARRTNITSPTDGTIQIVFRTKSTGGASDMYFDDIISYASTNSTTDIVKPSTATGLILTGNSLSWVEGTDANTGVQATYILRTTNASATVPVLSDQVAYAATNTVGDWTVIGTVNVGTTTYTDINGGSSYYYTIVHRDLAYNNSAASLINGVSTEVNTASKPNAQVFVNAQNELVINASENSNYAIYNAKGQLIENGTLKSKMLIANCKLQTGLYVVKVNDKTIRVIVK
jgi:hypothetical protein